jgi:ammonia channel protein AmtB
LTVITVFGLIGTVVTGIFGMNVFGLGEMPLPVQLALLAIAIVLVTALLFYTLTKSKALADFLDSVSDERLSTSAKVQSLINVWRTKRR